MNCFASHSDRECDLPLGHWPLTPHSIGNGSGLSITWDTDITSAEGQRLLEAAL